MTVHVPSKRRASADDAAPDAPAELTVGCAVQTPALSTTAASNARTMAPAGVELVCALLYRLDEILDHFFRIAEHHHRLVHVEERIVESGVTRCHRALVHDDGLRFVG